MKTSLLKTIRNPEGGNRRNRVNNKVITFLICIAISVFLWLMNMLSKKYTEDVSFHIEYQHLPKDKSLAPSTALLTVKVTSTGYNIMAYKLGIKNPFIKVDANQFYRRRHRYVYSLDNTAHLEKVEEQLGEEVKVVEVMPDTLYLQNNPKKD